MSGGRGGALHGWQRVAPRHDRCVLPTAVLPPLLLLLPLVVVVVVAGSVFTDCEEVCSLELTQPTGWVHIPFLQPDKKGHQRYLRANMLLLIIVSNHEAGRDCHIRGIKVMGPAGGTGSGPAAAGGGGVAAAAAADASKAAGGSASSSSSSSAPLLLSGAFEDPALTQFATLR